MSTIFKGAYLRVSTVEDDDAIITNEPIIKNNNIHVTNANDNPAGTSESDIWESLLNGMAEYYAKIHPDEK